MTTYAIVMGISLIITTIMLVIIARQKPKNQMQQIFVVNMILLFVLCFFIFLQIMLSEPLNIEPVYFEYFAYIGGCFIPVSIFMTSLIFTNTKITFKKRYLALLIIPTLSLIMLWTNDIHHLFYEQYSIYLKQTVFGAYANIYSLNSYLLLLLAIIQFIRGTIKNSNFFSIQGLLILIGVLFPVIVNLLGTFGIINITVYITPISFLVAIAFFALAIFKFNFLNVNPVALQRIVDRISDGYIVLNDQNVIIDFNKTFIDMFNLSKTQIRKLRIENLLDNNKENKNTNENFLKIISEIRKNDTEYSNIIYFKKYDKYFNIEINNIKNNSNIIGTLILFKDVTQLERDKQLIKNNQDILIEQERLASLGQMIGGIAHNLKTPIMSVGGAAEGITDLIKEYKLSIKDSEVTIEDHEQIANEMNEWVEKIKTHISYMSDVITAVKGQAVTLSESTEITFSVDELIKRIDLLMKHELKNAIIYLKTTNNVPSDVTLTGNINGLVQVVNNIISNAIQAYKGKTNENIDLVFNKVDNNIVIAIRDYAGGIPEKIKNKIFSEMITTKGKNGTGLGLFMSYSNIKAHFGGDITFETEENVETTFYITIPVK